MDTLKERKDIASSDCWDKTKIIKDEEEYQELLSFVKKKNKEILKLKGHILDSADSLLKFLKTMEEESRAYDKLHIYTRFLFDEDTRSNESKERLLEIESLASEINESESFITSEFMKSDYETVKKILKESKELKIYERYIEELYKNKDRILSEQEENIIQKAISAFGTPDDAFTSLDTTDATFDPIVVDGRETEITHYNYAKMLEHKDQKVRKDAFKSYNGFYGKHKNTFASLLKGNYQELEFLRGIRKYPSALSMALDESHIKDEVYNNLIASVHKYMDININYQKLKASMLNLKEYHLYDSYVSVVEKPKNEYTKEEAIKLISEALKPLGEDYLKHFHKIFEEHTVDFYPCVGKYTGAYQWGCYDSPSYVLLNFNGTYDSVTTIAHEMGHAVHTMYSNTSNPYIYASYDIFLAEIASTVNEVLLSSYLMDHAASKSEKIYYLCEFLDRVKATIYRQTMFAEFENIMSKKCQEKMSLTESSFTDTYYDLNKEYFKDSVIVDEEIRYECYRIPH